MVQETKADEFEISLQIALRNLDKAGQQYSVQFSTDVYDEKHNFYALIIIGQS